MWFWSEGHQHAEREAEDELTGGRYRDFDDAESFLADLEALHSSCPASAPGAQRQETRENQGSKD